MNGSIMHNAAAATISVYLVELKCMDCLHPSKMDPKCACGKETWNHSFHNMLGNYFHHKLNPCFYCITQVHTPLWMDNCDSSYLLHPNKVNICYHFVHANKMNVKFCYILSKIIFWLPPMVKTFIDEHVNNFTPSRLSTSLITGNLWAGGLSNSRRPLTACLSSEARVLDG